MAWRGHSHGDNQVPSYMREIVEALWQSPESCCSWAANSVLLYPDMSQRRQREAFQFEQSQPLTAEALGAGLADVKAAATALESRTLVLLDLGARSSELWVLMLEVHHPGL